MNKELKILQSNIIACGQRIAKLQFSIDKTKPLFPLTLKTIQTLTSNQEESIDALILRYAQSVAMIQDHLFRGIAYVEQEDISDKSNRDKALLMEKLGAIQSADEFGTATILRNKFSHHYPEEVHAQIERLNLAHQEAEYVVETYQSIVVYLERKKLINGV